MLNMLNNDRHRFCQLFWLVGLFVSTAAVPVVKATSSPIEKAAITSGVIWKDDQGRPVELHGLGLLAPPLHPLGTSGKYYFVGTSKKTQSSAWLSSGINLYSTFDLQHWHFEAQIFTNESITTPIPTGEALQYRMERPKLLYNALTKKYVLYFHLDSSHFKMGMVAVATSNTIDGDYKFVRGYQPDGLVSFDMTMYQDHASGAAYLIRSVHNSFVGISQLAADFLDTTGIISNGSKFEGQTMWKDSSGKGYYMLGSHLSGWKANAAILSHTNQSTLHGATWTVVGNPSFSSTTFNSQSTFVLPYRHSKSGKMLYIYMADRWNNAGPGSVGNASYVWLPMTECTTTSSAACGGLPYKIHGLDGSGDGVWKIDEY